MPSNNFKQFDESKNLMMNDTDYSSNTQRQNGVTPGIAEPKLHNKLYYQVSTMAKAFGDYIVEKGYESNDSNVKELTTSINNAINKAIDDKTKGVYLPVGGGTINGDLHITGNLIIGDSDVAEDNQVTSDLIQDLYNKVYQPSQTIYVDQKIGNDKNKGTNLTNDAVRTIDRAIDLIKDGVPNITIQLNTYTKAQGGDQYNEFYVSKSIDCSKLDTMKFITTYEPYRLDHSVAKVHVPYVKKNTGIYDYQGDRRQYYVWGHWMFIRPKDLYIQSVEFVFPEDNDVTITDSTNYYNGVIEGTSGTKVNFNDFYDNSMNIKNNCCYINTGSDIEILRFANGSITGKGILISQHQPRMFKDDPKTAGTDSNSIAGSTNGSKIIIDKINVYNDLRFTGNILGDSGQGFNGSNFKVGLWF